MPEKKLTDEAVTTIVRLLNERTGGRQCPMCGKGPFLVLDGYVAPNLHKNIGEAFEVFGEQTVYPCAAICCQHCGFISYHSLGTLGVMDLFQPKADQPKEGGNG